MEQLFLTLIRLVFRLVVHMSVPISEIVIEAVTIRVFMHHHLIFALLDSILLTFVNIVLLVIIILLIVRAILDVVLLRLLILKVRLRCGQRSGLGSLFRSLALFTSSFCIELNLVLALSNNDSFLLKPLLFKSGLLLVEIFFELGKTFFEVSL